MGADAGRAGAGAAPVAGVAGAGVVWAYSGAAAVARMAAASARNLVIIECGLVREGTTAHQAGARAS